MADLSTIAKATKRVTFEDIYTAIDVLKDRQSEDLRHLNQRIDIIGQRVDNLATRIDNLGSQVNQRIDQLSQKFDSQIGQLSQKLDSQIGQVNQRIDSQIGQVNQRIDRLNQRFDTVVQMLLDLSKQISSQKNH
ncbi:MAG: hypothetical protein K6U11_11465 [bacterium]|nr:hypothetical protein [bacterium]